MSSDNVSVYDFNILYCGSKLVKNLPNEKYAQTTNDKKIVQNTNSLFINEKIPQKTLIGKNARFQFS